MAVLPRFFSTEDWVFDPVTSKDGNNNPFDLSIYELHLEFRTAPGSEVIDDCSTTNGKIVYNVGDTSKVAITSKVTDRIWMPSTSVLVYGDLMGFRASTGRTIGVGRFAFYVDPGVTR